MKLRRKKQVKVPVRGEAPKVPVKRKPIPKKKWVAPQPWVAHPNQVTVEQCCKYYNLNDYPILVNGSLKEKFKDFKKFEEYAIPLMVIANPAAHPLILNILLKAKWFEVMKTTGLCYSQPQ